MSRISRLANRPLGDRDRRRAFGASVALLLGAAALLLALPSAGPAVAPQVSTPAQSRPAPELNSLEIAVARRFLAGYLPYLYGQGPVAAIRAATPALLRRLHRNRQPVPPAALGRSPRLVRIETHPAADGQEAASAQVDDGSVTYPIELGLLRSDGHWLVTSVGGD